MFGWFKKKEQEAPEVFTAVGYLDHSFKTGEKGADKFAVRMMFAIGDRGNRKIHYNIDALASHFRLPLERTLAITMKSQVMQECRAWEQGGPLPETFIPLKVSTVKPEKLPPSIRHDYNDQRSRDKGEV